MDIQNTLCSWGSSFSSAVSSCGSSLKEFGETAVEKGKLGYNRAVTVMSDNPRTTLISAVATVAFAAGAAWCLSASNEVK